MGAQTPIITRLTPGTRLGPYEVLSLLGAGGMGEVYRAKDSTLKREVALKVLPADVAKDRERLARFQREAEVLASLNHPHIAQIYGLEHAGDTFALVMELVEGEDLAQRIARGAIPLDEALPIARQIAEALEAAHEHGIIHRDLKPANIKVRPDGTVKVLDFGLAKAVDPTAGSSTTAMNSPTLSIHATEAGLILGTAAYMSPEQARGKSVDKRTDIWALACVLFEMLTGKRAFQGDDATDTIVAVMSKEPDWSSLPVLPPGIRRLLRRSLEKDPKRRLDSAAGARIEIDEALGSSPAEVQASAPSSLWRRLLPWALVAGLVITLAVARRTGEPGPRSPLYASLEAPPGFVLGSDTMFVSLPSRTPMVFTPDGRSLILELAQNGKRQLFQRSLDQPGARPIAGTEGARGHFISPDGKWIGFWVANEMKKVSVGGGVPSTICATQATNGPYGSSWGAGDVIVFGDRGSGRIMKVSANGGTPAPFSAAPVATDNRQHVAPNFLPDGRRILYSDVSTYDATNSQLMVQSLDGGDARLVVSAATDGRFLPSGHLAFMRLGTLMTVPFDLAHAVTTGEPVAAMSGVAQSGVTGVLDVNHTGSGMFAVSSLGALAAVRGPVAGAVPSRLVWVTRDGKSLSAEPPAGGPVGGRLIVRISPDEAYATVAVQTPMRRELWFADWKRAIWTLCDDCASERVVAEWSHDGSQILLSREGALVAYRVDRSAASRVLLRESGRSLLPAKWLADGRILYLSSPDQSNFEIKVLEPGAESGRVVVPLGGGTEPDVSPDGRWLAYRTGQGQQANVIVQAFPGPGSRTQVSAGYSVNPAWSADSRTLFYLRQGPEGLGSTMFAVAVAPGAALTVGSPRELFHHPEFQQCGPGRCFDVTADGQRFLLRERAPRRDSVTRMDLVTNWTSTLGTGR